MEREQDTSCKQIHGTGRVEAAENLLPSCYSKFTSWIRTHEVGQKGYALIRVSAIADDIQVLD